VSRNAGSGMRSERSERSERARVERELKRFLFGTVLEGAPQDRDPFAAGLVDSLALEQVLGFVEERFGVTMQDEEVAADRLTSLQDLVDLIVTKRAAAR
jgi:acyl carrier protein